MGFFSNSTEGHAFEARWCARCVHRKPESDGCAVMLAHQLHAYEATGATAEVLSLLIPRSKDDAGNNQCAMFITVEDVKRRRVSKRQMDLFSQRAGRAEKE